MTDTPQHIKNIHLKGWLNKAPGERLYRAIIDNDTMYKALREYKISKGLPLGDLDPVAEYLQKKETNKAAAGKK